MCVPPSALSIPLNSDDRRACYILLVRLKLQAHPLKGRDLDPGLEALPCHHLPCLVARGECLLLIGRCMVMEVAIDANVHVY